MKSACIILIFLSITPIVAITQVYPEMEKQKNFSFISANYHYGNVLATNDFVKGDNLSNRPLTSYQSVALKFGFQNPDYTDWQRAYKAPYYGIGLYLGDFHTNEIGYPLAVYGFYGIPVKRWKKLELYSEFQFGMAWNWNHYDPESNPKNVAIGSGFTVYLDLGINATYPISNDLDLGLGLSFTHFSNGGFERPNRGLNLIAPSIEVKYFFNGRPDVRHVETVAKNHTKNNELNFMLAHGNHQIVEHEFDTNYYSVAGLGISYSIPHGNVYRSGIGVDLNYMRSLSANEDGTPGIQGTWNNLTIGLIYTPELVIDRFSIVGGLGIYAKHYKYGNFTQLYQRAGVKYHFTKNFSLGINVRAINFMLAEFLEFNLGYKIQWTK